MLTFLLLLPSNRQLNKLIVVSFYSAMTTELVLAELQCCGCERVFCNSLYFMFLHFFILWAVVSAGYPALLSSSYFERINDDDDDVFVFQSSSVRVRKKNRRLRPRQHGALQILYCIVKLDRYAYRRRRWLSANCYSVEQWKMSRLNWTFSLRRAFKQASLFARVQ